MDTSEIYIEMCKKARKIRKLHPIQVGDYYVHNAYNDLGIITHKYEEHENSFLREDFYQFHNLTRKCMSFDLIPSHITWLPRQDQLQEMLHSSTKWDFKDLTVLIREFKCFIWRGQDIIAYPIKDYPLDICESMEQLWLAFVMKEMFNNIWNGEDWILKESD